ncbi:MAG: hypothetical protein ACI85O_000753 [Saprospiraceae bacterium]|jgi:hypothetical protein
MKYILSIALIFSTLTAFSQVGLSADNHAPKVDIPSFSFTKIQKVKQQSDTQSLIFKEDKSPDFLHKCYSYEDLAFFCKIEVQLENVVKFPVKFRLGSVDYVDYLEGKGKGSY